MLRVKYIESFKNNHPFIVVLADREGLRIASEHFSRSADGFLDNPAITEFCDIAPLTHHHLYLTPDECIAIVQHFKNLYETNEPQHAYFDTLALGNDIEILISFGEYEGLF